MDVGTGAETTNLRKIQLGILLAAMAVAALLAPSGLRAVAGESPPTQTFIDVPPSHPFFDDIEWMADNGISEGWSTPGGLEYRPTLSVSRAAMAAFMYRLAGEPPYSPPGTPTFPDVPTNHPFYKEIEWLVDEGVTTGFPDGNFRPGASVTRQSMSAFMYRLAGSPVFVPPVTPTFEDVPLTHPFYDEIEWMADEGITTGFPNGTYRPNDNVTRQAMSAFMHRLADCCL